LTLGLSKEVNLGQWSISEDNCVVQFP
jgi:hypothetical protein